VSSVEGGRVVISFALGLGLLFVDGLVFVVGLESSFEFGAFVVSSFETGGFAVSSFEVGTPGRGFNFVLVGRPFLEVVGFVLGDGFGFVVCPRKLVGLLPVVC
jgi:hypothetical protein